MSQTFRNPIPGYTDIIWDTRTPYFLPSQTANYRIILNSGGTGEECFHAFLLGGGFYTLDVIRTLAHPPSSQMSSDPKDPVPLFEDTDADATGYYGLDSSYWTGYVKPPLEKASTKEPIGCGSYHDWATYEGFSRTFEYCKKCDIKRGEK